MKKLFYCLILLPLIIIFLESCKDNSLMPEQIFNDSKAVNVPLSIGNKWTYFETEYDASGNVISTNKKESEITRDTLIEGKKWFIEHNIDSNATWEIILRNENDELLMWDNRYSSITTLLKYPPFSSDTFNITYHIIIDGHDTTFTYKEKIDTISTIVSIPNGKYYSYKYSNTYFTFSFIYESGFDGVEVFPSESYYSNIGNIKTLSYMYNSNNKLYLKKQIELISYRIK